MSCSILNYCCHHNTFLLESAFRASAQSLKDSCLNKDLGFSTSTSDPYHQLFCQALRKELYYYMGQSIQEWTK